MAQETLLTIEALKQLEAELEDLKVNGRKEAAEKIKLAKSFGDLSENSEYDEARDQQAKVESRIAELEYLMKNAVIIDTDAVKNVVSLGSTVILKYTDGTEKQYDLVGSNEVDPMNKKISDQSPIGAALMGKRVDDEVTAEVPNGTVSMKVLAVSRTQA